MVGDILQPTHLLFILVVALLVLGPKRLPEVGRALGRGLRDFRDAISGEEHPDRAIPPESAPTPVVDEPPPEGLAESEPREPVEAASAAPSPQSST